MNTRLILAVALSVGIIWLLVPTYFVAAISFTTGSIDLEEFLGEVLRIGLPTLALNVIFGSLFLRRIGISSIGRWLLLFIGLSALVVLVSQPMGAILHQDTIADQVMGQLFGEDRSLALLALVAFLFSLPPGAIMGLVTYKIHQWFDVLPKSPPLPEL